MKKRRTKKYRDTPDRKAYREGGVRYGLIETAILGSALMTKEDQIARLDIVRPAFDAFAAGRATQTEIREVLTVHNVLLAISAIPGVLAGDVRDFLRITNETLVETSRRRHQGEDPTPTADELEVIWAMFNLFVDVLANVSMRHIERAESTVHKRVTNRQNAHNLLEEFRAV